MQNQSLFSQDDPMPLGVRWRNAATIWQQQPSASLTRKQVTLVIMAIALVAFEIFNFDTTRFALHNLLGDVRFIGMAWASILAVAFCAIDFAGLVRLFAPESAEASQQKESHYLLGAWLLGATMNAVMTWWAVSLTLLQNNNFGNEILGRDTLLNIVPIFVAFLVWLTRILFIGSLTMTGNQLLRHQQAFGEEQREGLPIERSVSHRPTPRPSPTPAQAQMKERATPSPHRPQAVVVEPEPQEEEEQLIFVAPPSPSPTNRPNQAPPSSTRGNGKPTAAGTRSRPASLQASPPKNPF